MSVLIPLFWCLGDVWLGLVALEAAREFAVGGEDHDGFTAWGGVGHGAVGELGHEFFCGGDGVDVEGAAGGFCGGAGDDFAAPGGDAFLDAGAVELGGEVGEELFGGEFGEGGGEGVNHEGVVAEGAEAEAAGFELGEEAVDALGIGGGEVEGLGEEEGLGEGGFFCGGGEAFVKDALEGGFGVDRDVALVGDDEPVALVKDVGDFAPCPW